MLLALAVSPPSTANRLRLSDHNTLLYDGLSTFSVADNGKRSQNWHGLTQELQHLFENVPTHSLNIRV